MPVSPSRMPGGSWSLDEEEEQPERLERQDLVILHTNKDGQKPSEVLNSLDSTALSAGDSTLRSSETEEPYQIVVLDPAELSEEISLLASPAASTTSKETWRVRISPDYDIEVLPPSPQRGRNSAGRHIRDSPEQRRSRFLDNIFPEIKDDIHSFSRCPTDTDSVAPTLDVDWDFDQYGLSTSALDSSVPSDEDLRASAEDSETLPALGLTFPTTSSVVEPSHNDAERPSSPSPSSPESLLADVDLSSCDHPISVPDASAPSHSENAHTGAENSESLPGLGLTFLFTSSDNPSHDEAERASSRSPSSVGSSFDDIDLGSPSPPVTSISMPSTARPLSSPSASDCTLRTDTPSSGFADSDVEDPNSLQVEASTGDPDAQTPSTAIHERPDDESAPGSDSGEAHDASNSPRHDSTANDPFLLPQCSLFDPATVADGNDSESLPSLLIRPATASVLSDDEADTEEGGGEHTEGQSEHLELEYLDEYQYPALTPLSLLGLEEISLPLSLDGSFEFRDDWVEVVPFHRSHGQDALFGDDAVGQPVVRSGNLPSATLESEDAVSGADDADAFAEGAQALEAVQISSDESQTSLAEAVTDLPHTQAGGSSVMANGMVIVGDGELFPHSPSLAGADSSVVEAQAPSEAPRPDEEERSLVAPAVVLCASEIINPQNDTVAVDDEDKQASRSSPSPAVSADHRFEDEFHGIPELPTLHFHLTSFPAADDLVARAQTSLEVEQLNSASMVVPQTRQRTASNDNMGFIDDEDRQALRSPPSPAASPRRQSKDGSHGIPELPALHFHLTSLPGADNFAAETHASSPTGPRLQHFASTSAAVPRASQRTAAKDGMKTAKGDQDRRPQSPSASTDDETLRTPPTPALPALHFPSPSLTDEVLSSPIFRLLDFDTVGSGSNVTAARTTARHARALTTSQIERRSILWAPHDTRELHDGRRASVHAGSKDKGKARPRARTLSFADDSRSRHGGEQRVEREVQTEVPVARDAVKRLKQKLRAERAKIAGLVRERDKSAEYERWEASWERKWQYFGGFSYDFEDGLM
ncbi:hypothetical protein DFH06DRAFT_1132166 [Mycena polygramma]|nr:hypothetical protein DFH06DRAFT_1132166 [Mycena polygramma]